MPQGTGLARFVDGRCEKRRRSQAPDVAQIDVPLRTPPTPATPEHADIDTRTHQTHRHALGGVRYRALKPLAQREARRGRSSARAAPNGGAGILLALGPAAIPSGSIYARLHLPPGLDGPSWACRRCNVQSDLSTHTPALASASKQAQHGCCAHGTVPVSSASEGRTGNYDRLSPAHER